MKKELGNVITRFINICCLTFIIMVFLGPVLHLIEGINNAQVGLLAICAAVAAFSSLVFISHQELHGISWWIREIICILINLIIILPLTFYAGLWHSLVGMVVAIVIILMVAFGNHLIEFVFDMITANEINEKIKELR